MKRSYVGTQRGLLFGFVFDNGILEIDFGFFWAMILVRK